MKNIVFTFEELGSDKASKKLSQVFAKAGANVVQATPSPKTQRTAGVTYRSLDLTFADGQTVTLMVKQTGDIYQVKLNGSVLPIKNQDDHKAAVTEIIKAMDSGRAKFQAKLAKSRAELPKGTKSVAPKLEETLTARIAELDKEISDKQAKVTSLQAELDAPVMDSVNTDDPDSEPDGDPDDDGVAFDPDSQASMFDDATIAGDTYVQLSIGGATKNVSPRWFAGFARAYGNADGADIDPGKLLKLVNDWNASQAQAGSSDNATMMTVGAGGAGGAGVSVLDGAGKTCDACGKTMDGAGKCMDKCGGKAMDKCCDKCGMDSADCECGEDQPFKREWTMLDSADYPVYHKTYSGACSAAIAYAEGKGYQVDEDDWQRTVAIGPRKPDEGKTNRFSIALLKDGKPQKKALQMQIYGRGDAGYELNAYIS